MKQDKNIDKKLEFERAMTILYKRIHCVDDLLKYWHFSRTMQRTSSINRRYLAKKLDKLDRLGYTGSQKS